MWEQLEHSISTATGTAFRIESRCAVGGGCINQALRLEGSGRRFFVKLNRAELLDMFEAEAAGLEAIALCGAVRVPVPVVVGSHASRSWLVLEHLQLNTRPDHQSAARMGEQLAQIHRCSDERFGWWRDNHIGSSPQSNTPDSDWPRFFGNQRLGLQLALAADNGAPTSLLKSGEQLVQHLHHFFDGYSPAPSLLHGDLWGGNWEAAATILAAGNTKKDSSHALQQRFIR